MPRPPRRDGVPACHGEPRAPGGQQVDGRGARVGHGDGAGPDLVAAGAFGLPPDGPSGWSYRLARWDGAEWRGVAGGVHGPSARALAWDGSGLYVGGEFGGAGEAGGSVPSANVARLLRLAVPAEPGPDPGGGAPALSLAGPNPFRERTALRLDLPAPARVRVAVYDALDREVAVLAAGALGEGRHPLALDGRALPVGVYVVRATVTAGGRGEAASFVRRLTVAR